MMMPEIQKVIAELQDSAIELHGMSAGNAWGNGFLGATLAHVLHNHVSVADADYILNELRLRTKQNLQKETA